ncbi:Costars domain-containing protein [Aphelenchoides bicaudatus]|nr:Costars domain-containing protein [Aphelenchoides bicaudatus]
MVDRFIKKFNTISDETDAKLKKNPYSDTYEEQHFDTTAKDYARPPAGSLTEKRGQNAGAYILREIIHLCHTIDKYGEGPTEARYIKFGPLFKIYQFYSESLVGYLIRARKYGLLDFEGEMLYQRQDDNKIIQMSMSMSDINENVKYSGDPKNCIHVANRPESSAPKPTPKKVDKEPQPNKTPAKSERAQKAIEKFKQSELKKPQGSYYNFCVG